MRSGDQSIPQLYLANSCRNQHPKVVHVNKAGDRSAANTVASKRLMHILVLRVANVDQGLADNSIV